MSASRWTTGAEVARLQRTMTAERMRWYCDALETLSHASPVPIIAGPNIHNDDAFARANGLAARVADGMVSTNWVSSLLAAEFGDGYLCGGTLRTRYVKPVFADDRLEVSVRVGGVASDRLALDISCVNQRGEIVTVGDATVTAG